jgi:hypothetical protein
VVAGALIDELNSRVGSGGRLTRRGPLDATDLMNRKRGMLRKVELLTETRGGLGRGNCGIFYQKVALG